MVSRVIARTFRPNSFAHSVFMRIAEPRVFRVLQLGVYLFLGFSGVAVLFHPPENLENVVGLTLLYVFGAFIALGSFFGSVAILPGIWWLERVALISLTTGILMYIVMAVSLGSSPVGVGVSIAFIFTFAQRWSEIRGALLAPKRG